MFPSSIVAEPLAPPRFAAARPSSSFDATAAAAASSAFAASPYRAVRCVRCRIEREALVLKGRLPSYYLKQIALATAKKIAGVRRIDDRLEVRPAERTDS